MNTAMSNEIEGNKRAFVTIFGVRDDDNAGEVLTGLEFEQALEEGSGDISTLVDSEFIDDIVSLFNNYGSVCKGKNDNFDTTDDFIGAVSDISMYDLEDFWKFNKEALEIALDWIPSPTEPYLEQVVNMTLEAVCTEFGLEDIEFRLADYNKVEIETSYSFEDKSIKIAVDVRKLLEEYGDEQVFE